MNPGEMIAALNDSRQKILDTIKGVSDTALTAETLMPGWSVKDLLVHLTIWEAEMITRLAHARAGKKPRYTDLSRKEIDNLNARWLAEFKDRSPDRVLHDYHQVRKQMIKQVEQMTDSDLADPKRFSWLRGKPLWEWIADESFGHENEHLPQLLTWRKSLEGK